jgi:hypothetical protein
LLEKKVFQTFSVATRKKFCKVLFKAIHYFGSSEAFRGPLLFQIEKTLEGTFELDNTLVKESSSSLFLFPLEKGLV